MAPSRSTSPGAATQPAHPQLQPNLPPAQLPQSHHLDLPSSAPPTRSVAANHDDQTARRVLRKLQKKRRDGEHTPTMELPERLKDHGDQADSEEEVLQAGGMFMNMNQSIFGLIAAAGSQADFADRFGGQSSDDEDEGESAMAMTIAGHKGSARQPEVAAGSPLAYTTVLRKPETSGNKSDGRHHRRKLSETRLFSRLSPRSKSSRHKAKTVTDDQIRGEQVDDRPSANAASDSQAPNIEITRTEGRIAPVMSRMLEARAEMAARPSFDLDRRSGEQPRDLEGGEAGPTELAKKLKEIFEFEEPEEVIEGKAPPFINCSGGADTTQSTHAGFSDTFLSRAICTSPRGTLRSTHICPRKP